MQVRGKEKLIDSVNFKLKLFFLFLLSPIQVPCFARQNNYCQSQFQNSKYKTSKMLKKYTKLCFPSENLRTRRQGPIWVRIILSSLAFQKSKQMISTCFSCNIILCLQVRFLKYPVQVDYRMLPEYTTYLYVPSFSGFFSAKVTLSTTPEVMTSYVPETQCGPGARNTAVTTICRFSLSLGNIFLLSM